MSAPSSVLEVRSMSLAYRGVQAVKAVSVTVRPGELVGLIGPNGAGKTSFIDAITGYASAARGSVKLGGKELGHAKPHLRARAGLIRTFQGLEIFDDLTVAENIEVGVRSSGRSLVTTDRELPFHLEQDRDRVAGSLSQGHRKMLALARALACSPEVLVLDEPAAGLDTSESKALGESLRRLIDRGLGILLVDHDMSLVTSVCDRILVLDFGTLIAEGDPRTIMNDPAVRRAYLGSEVA